MKEKVKEIMLRVKGVKPQYFIEYTVMDGEIVILSGTKSYPSDGKVYPDMIWGDSTAELRENDEVIAKFEKDGVNEEKAAQFRAKLWQEMEKDYTNLRNAPQQKQDDYE